MINYEYLIDDLKHEADKLPMKFSRNDELFQTLLDARRAIAELTGLNSDPDLKIKSCPFCGERFQHIEEGRESFRVVCTSCGAMTGGYPSEARAIRAWNKRRCREDFCPVQE